ncbi:MAG: VIT1/CCC1 transporter family protein [Anaerolineae bacterium]
MSISKRIEDARRAFDKRDLEAAREAHALERIAHSMGYIHTEVHGAASHAYLSDMVYGGLDGIVTTFAVVSGVAGAQLGVHVVLILGLANLFADGFSMATGAYLSTRAEREYYQRELAREHWEVEHMPEAERAELYEIYRQQGYTEEDAKRLVEIKTRDPELWVKAMMVEELGLLPDERKPFYSALATFGAFVLAGAVPMLIYLAGLLFTIPEEVRFLAAANLSAAALFGLGAAKVLVTGLNPLRSGLEMLLVGGLAAGVAYGVGVLLRGLGV